MPLQLSRLDRLRFANNGVKCKLVPTRIQNLSDYFSILGSSFSDTQKYWFRGHSDQSWPLTPSALRYSKLKDRETALNLLVDFKRLVEFRLRRAPLAHEELKWVQIAQHYGLPTRLLDWTESATTALYFACLRPNVDGLVFIINPIDLNRVRDSRRPRIFDAQSDSDLIDPYLRLDGRQGPKKRLTNIAIKPVLNDERIIVQKGVFTLHGNKSFRLMQSQASSLVAIPIFKETKPHILMELSRAFSDHSRSYPAAAK